MSQCNQENDNLYRKINTHLVNQVDHQFTMIIFSSSQNVDNMNNKFLFLFVNMMIMMNFMTFFRFSRNSIWFFCIILHNFMFTSMIRNRRCRFRRFCFVFSFHSACLCFSSTRTFSFEIWNLEKSCQCSLTLRNFTRLLFTISSCSRILRTYTIFATCVS